MRHEIKVGENGGMCSLLASQSPGYHPLYTYCILRIQQRTHSAATHANAKSNHYQSASLPQPGGGYLKIA
jgi:hypothetical protein